MQMKIVYDEQTFFNMQNLNFWRITMPLEYDNDLTEPVV